MIGLVILLLAASAPDGTDQQILDHISVSCGLSAGDITIDQGKRVRIRPKQTPTYEAVMCTLPKLKESGFVYPVGFIAKPRAKRNR